MHTRKTRKAKAAASEFVKRVISGKDVSPDRHPITTGRGAKSASKQVTKSSQKSTGRGRSVSPRTASRPGGGSRRSASQSPSRATETKAKTQSAKAQSTKAEPTKSQPAKSQPAKTQAQTAKAKPVVTKQETPTPPTKKRGRPPKHHKSQTPAVTVSKVPQDTVVKTGRASRSSASRAEEKCEKSSEKTTLGRRRGSGSPAAKLIPSKGKTTPNDESEEEEEKEEEDGEEEEMESSVLVSPVKEEPDDPPDRGAAEPMDEDDEVDSATPDKAQSESGSKSPVTQQSPRSGVPTPQMLFSRQLSASPGALSGAAQTLRISPTAKILPMVPLSPKNIFTISIPGSSLPKTATGNTTTSFIVNAQPVGGVAGASPIKLTATATATGSGQVTLDLVQIPLPVASPSSAAAAASSGCPQSYSDNVDVPEVSEVDLSIVKSEPESPPAYINKSPKLSLLSTGKKKEPVSEGKIKKRKHSKTPAWDVPSAVYQTSFEAPQPKFLRQDDKEISYPETAQMEQGAYFKIMGIISKADIKKTDGNEHRNHRLAGGRLRRVCKPKISPEMVYRRFSLARGCIIRDVFVAESDDDNHDGHSPKVADKIAVIKTEQSKKGTLSPRIHDSYKQHIKKIPVINLENVTSDGETSPSKMRIHHLNYNPHKKSANSPKSKSKQGARKQLDLKSGGSKGLTRSKSFDGASTKGKSLAKPSSMTKHKSFENRMFGTKAMPIKIEPEEEDDGSKRRSSRNKGSRRKQWWHLLRANPDEFEEDKDGWGQEMAAQEEKKRARLDRARERAEEEGIEEVNESEEEEEEPEEEKLKTPPQPKKSKKKSTKTKKEADIEEVKDTNPKGYTVLYESKLKNKKQRSADWALAKKVLEVHEKGKGKEDTVETAGSSKGKKGGKKDGGKRKVEDPPSGEGTLKKIKTEPISVHNSDEEVAPAPPAEKSSDKKPKKKKSLSGSAETEDIVEIKPEIIHTNLIILGENGEPLELKNNTQIYDQLQNMLEGRGAEKLARTGVLELSMPPNSPQSFIEILARQQQKQKRRPQSPLGMLPIIRSDVLYKTKERECITPHMCNVCWINDHMYCRNMKRIARDLPLCGGCIHYVPCKHYIQRDSPSAVSRRHLQRRVQNYSLSTDESSKTTFVTPVTTPGSTPAARRISFSPTDELRDSGAGDSLMCEETLTESDSEPNSPEAPPPPGTELLKAEIRARAQQMKRSLGFKSLPRTISPLKRKLAWASPQRFAAEDDGMECVVIETDEDEETSNQEVAITEYGCVETVGTAMPEGTDYGVPLGDEYMMQDGERNKTCWETGTSIFNPNTESDASNDSFEIPPEYMTDTATEHRYEESVYGENSQDSTETSLSQISTHVDSDDGGSENTPVSQDDKHLKKKKKSMSDIIRVKSVGGQPISEAGLEGLKNKWQKSEDGTQVLTFTTKEIRERRPELLNYIKRAGLNHVITDKLNQEQASIKKLIKDNESALRQSQDKLEQHRCLMAAVLSEILSVKEQLKDLQVALTDDETLCSKLRSEKHEGKKECRVADMKVKVLKKILLEAAQRGLANTNTIPIQTDPGTNIQPPTPASTQTPVAAQATPADTPVIAPLQEIVLEEPKFSQHQTGPTGDSLSAIAASIAPTLTPTVSAEGVTEVSSVAGPQPSTSTELKIVQGQILATGSDMLGLKQETIVSELTPQEAHVQSAVNQHHKIHEEPVVADGSGAADGSTLPHEVMLELPKDILQQGEGEALTQSDVTPMEISADLQQTELSDQSQILTDEPQDVLTNQSSTVTLTEQSIGTNEQEALLQQVEEEHTTSASDLIQDLADLPTTAQPTGSIITDTETPAVIKSDFESLIMRPGELGDVILQTSDVSGAQQQTEQQDHGLVVSQQQPDGLVVTQQQPEGLVVTQQQPDGIVVTQQQPEGLVVTQQQPEGLVVTQQQPEGLVVTQQQPDGLVVTQQQPEGLMVAQQQPAGLVVTQQQPDSLMVAQQQPEGLVITQQQSEGLVVAQQQPEGLVVAQQQSEGLVVAQQQPEGLVVAQQQPEGLVVTQQQPEGLMVTQQQPEGLVVAQQQPEGLMVTQPEGLVVTQAGSNLVSSQSLVVTQPDGLVVSQPNSLIVSQADIPLSADSFNSFLARQENQLVVSHQEQLVQVSANQEQFVHVPAGQDHLIVSGQEQFVHVAGQDQLVVSADQHEEPMIVQDVVTADNIIQQQSTSLIQAGADGTATLFMQEPQAASTSGVLSGHHNVVIDDPIQALQPGESMLIQEPAAPSESDSGVVLQQGTEGLVLQNLDLVQGLTGQVQTIMINGQPYQVILQSADQA